MMNESFKNEKALKQIEQATGCHIDIVQLFSICDKKPIPIQKEFLRVTLSNRKEYLVKTIHMSENRVKEYREICSMALPELQKTSYIGETGDLEHLVIAEWIDGVVLDEVSFDNGQNGDVIKTAARSLRTLHDQTMTDRKVLITKEDLHSFICCGVLKSETEQILYDFMSNMLPIINTRNKAVTHGDMHTGNMLLESYGEIRFIDLDDVSYRDPLFDLTYASNLILHKHMRPFYYTFLHEYFGGELPKDFWPIVNFYSFAKALMILKEEMKKLNGKTVISLERLIEEHDGRLSEEPYWYKSFQRDYQGLINGQRR